MAATFEQKLEQYAEVVVRVGLNLQPGQRLFISSPIDPETLPFVRMVSAKAYDAGARYVSVLWHDEQLTLVRLQHAPKDSFDEYPAWLANARLEFAEAGDAILSISASDPDLLIGQDPELIATMRKTAAKHNEPASKLTSRSAMNWLVVSAPTKAWARKIFEGASDDVLVPALWDAIFATCRINASDPVAAWEAHLADLAARHAYLNNRRYTALRLAGPGTDLTIGLPEGHIWMGGQVTSGNGITFTPNLPTEEVFSMPQRDRVDGTVASTKPLNLGGSLIEDFSLTFQDGAVVDVKAEKGEEHLRKLLDTDDGARRLGEIALVPHSSPISASGLLFYNTLYDENASCHVALGRAYRMTMENGGAMDDDAFAAAGGNNSLIHVDFMIGSGELDIDGIMASGEAEPVMRGGEWAFEV